MNPINSTLNQLSSGNGNNNFIARFINVLIPVTHKLIMYNALLEVFLRYANKPSK